MRVARTPYGHAIPTGRWKRSLYTVTPYVHYIRPTPRALKKVISHVVAGKGLGKGLQPWSPPSGKRRSGAGGRRVGDGGRHTRTENSHRDRKGQRAGETSRGMDPPSWADPQGDTAPTCLTIPRGQRSDEKVIIAKSHVGHLFW